MVRTGGIESADYVKTQLITFDDGETTARIEVSAAKVKHSLERTNLMLEADAEQNDRFKAYRKFYYASLAACVNVCEINGAVGVPAWDQFLELPEALLDEWDTACYALNPQWMLKEPDPKAGSS